MNFRPLLLPAALVVLASGTANGQGDPSDVPAALKQADRLFKDQQWAEAGTRYDAVRTRLADWHSPDVRRAVEGAVACAVRLTRWDDALSQLEAYVAHNPDTLDEVAGQRLLAGLYLSMPHDGVVQGGRFLRGQSGQGSGKDVEDSDEREAVTRLERAREVAARLAAARPAGAPEADRLEIEQAWIGTDFDLSTAVTRLGTALGGRDYSSGEWLGIQPPDDRDPENPAAPGAPAAAPGRDEQARVVLRNLLQFIERDDTNETARVRTPADGWWFWWNDDIQTNAWTLKALVALDPHNDLAPRLVKWLLDNRRNGSYWRSTRDTAQVIAAMTDYLLASGESAPDYRLTASADGEEMRDVHVTRANLFAFDNRVVLSGLPLKPGPHEVVIHKQGAGALYYACRLTYFTHEEGVRAAGNEIGIERQYFKLAPKTAAAHEPADPADHASTPPEPRADETPVLLKDGDELASGDLLEVSLKITARNTYDYLAFEDPKPAGCEPVEVRSGERWQEGFCANVELRETKTVFFVELLEQGTHLLRYRLRAETPGKFHVLPAMGTAMYAPELRASSDETHLNVRDRGDERHRNAGTIP